MFSWYGCLIVNLVFPHLVFFFWSGNLFLIAPFPDHKLRNTFSNVGLKTLLGEGLSETEFYGDLVYKFKKLIGMNDFLFSSEKALNVTDV